jgi:predicted GH43/DUF377 family glycosyl hydrolase
MSWTDVFPVLDDDLVSAYESDATPGEKAEADAWFAVDRIVNRSKAKHLVAFSLFWKNARSDEPDLPPLDRETLLQAQEKGIVSRFAPWEHYVQPLLNGARRMQEKRPDVVFRIYLAADLHFLTEDFTALGCEVVLMKSSSLRHNPGAMWRFLALEERGKLITISDSDRAPLVEADIQRTELMAKIGLGFWRVPVWGEVNDKGMMGYRPVLACQFGSNKPLPSAQLMKALIWHTRKGSISTQCKPPGCGEQTIYGTQWPDYGFDEWFLQAAVYPRAARRGVLSFIPASARSRLLPIDVEYCTWANPRSEVQYFGSDGKCCVGAPAAVQAGVKAWRTTQSSFPNPSWRNYNPSILCWRGKVLMAYRSQPGHDSGDDAAGTSRIWICELDRSMRHTRNHRMIRGLQGVHQEDPRLFEHRGRLHVSYTAASYPSGRPWQCRMHLAELSPRMAAVRHYDLTFGVNGAGREKNWQFLSDAGRLRVCYTISPHTVFDYETREIWGDLAAPGWEYGNPSGGTPPVKVGDQWISFFHSHDGASRRRYFAGAYAFSATDYKVTAMTRRPLLSASEEDGFVFDRSKVKWQPLCVFPCGAVYRPSQRQWLVSYGINDSYCGLFTIRHKELLRLLTPVR